MRAKLVALLVVVIAFLALGLTAYHYKLAARDAVAAKEAAERSLATAIAVNADNEKAMTALENAKAKGEQLAADLAAEVDAANQTTLGIAKTLAELRSKDADVDAYLKQPVPGALRGVYDHAAAGGR
ncbi:hypothetical protein EN851_07920 [Mesorhizobium sp. M8A.F.Ca.ET.208.01.1.1]|uniref:hypothetical protein n=1 Tax=unclassified Mesorhizobium TaxID=325217 RepID=UPI001093E876|nr:MULTISPECIES: hypothetical protein [unclassified Mesorhizobium]TGQ95435.1 hypothetical protein EN851_07920 [Mesorhizobium sp. M8A.F.Ca.ET.208.01.1.1]TGT55926.1 hypothetical protein EN810_07920 [Mesorhizobium sp. M8A.F.Ca.ET.167.01.1.1]